MGPLRDIFADLIGSTLAAAGPPGPPQNKFSIGECCIPPQINLFGQHVNIDTILFPLVLSVPFMIGIMGAKQRALAVGVMVLILVTATLLIMSDEAKFLGTQPFNLKGFGTLALYSAPPFLIGLIIPRLSASSRSNPSPEEEGL